MRAVSWADARDAATSRMRIAMWIDRRMRRIIRPAAGASLQRPPEQQTAAETGLGRADHLEAAGTIELLGVGIADHVQRGHPLPAHEVHAVIDQHPADALSP